MTEAGYAYETTLKMTPRQIAANLNFHGRKKKRDLAMLLSTIQVATSQDKRSIKARLKELSRDSE